MHVRVRDQINQRSLPTDLPGCRFCSAPLRQTFVDLGMSPLCESYVPAERLGGMEPFYPLHVRICEQCLLVQLEELVAPEEIFTEYAYFSSYSDSWVAHAHDYVESVVERFELDGKSQVIELASNDGYLLQHVVERGIPALGVEPAANVAETARERGIETVVEFFGRELASRLVREGRQADLLVANNVFAHVPDLNDFTAGMKLLLAPQGVVTIEFPHIARLIELLIPKTVIADPRAAAFVMQTAVLETAIAHSVQGRPSTPVSEKAIRHTLREMLYRYLFVEEEPPARRPRK